MTTKTLPALSDMMADIDFCMLETHTDGHQIAARPMSNNGKVAYEGTSRFFTYDTTRMVSDIRADDRVALTFQGRGGLKGLMGAPGVMIAVQGAAQIIDDRAAFADHWDPSLERWFPQGIETVGMVMLQVVAHRIAYWDGEDQGSLTM